MLEKLDVVLSNDDIDLHDIDFDHVKFVSDGMGLVSIDINYINLDDDNFDKDDHKTVIHFRLILSRSRFKQHKA